MKKHTSNYHLSRDHGARKALFKGLIRSLIEKEKITTTMTKATATRPIFEKLLTKAKIGSVAKIREIHATLGDNKLVSKLVHEIAPRYTQVKGGYTKITRSGTRRGDNAVLAIWSLTHQQPNSSKSTPSSPKEEPKESSPSSKTKQITAIPKESHINKTVKPVKLAPSRAGKRGDK